MCACKMHIVGQTHVSVFDKYESLRIIIVARQQPQTQLFSLELRDLRGKSLANPWKKHDNIPL